MKIVKREHNIANGLQGQKIGYVCLRLAGDQGYRHGIIVDGELYHLIKGEKNREIDPLVKKEAAQKVLKELGGERSC